MVVVKIYTWHIFFIWTEGEDKLEGFLNSLNNFHPNLKFTHEKSKSSVNFLDMSVSIVDNKLETDFSCKPRDCYQFLHFNSAHSFHNKKLIAYCQGLRIKRLCSHYLSKSTLKNWKFGFVKQDTHKRIATESCRFPN